MKKDKQKLTKFIQKHWIAAYFCAALIIAVVVNIGMRLPIVSFNTSLKSDTWLTFWGSYLGGAIGCLPAIASYRHSIDESSRQHKESEESRRLAVMPVFDCRIRYVSTEYAKNNSSNFFLVDPDGVLREAIDDGDDWSELYFCPDCNYIDLCNCGLGPALQVKLRFKDHCVDLFNLKNGYTAHYIFSPSIKYFLSSNAKHTVCFTVECQDIYGNLYAQELSFKVSRSFEGKIDYLSFQTVSVGTARLVGHS